MSEQQEQQHSNTQPEELDHEDQGVTSAAGDDVSHPSGSRTPSPIVTIQNCSADHLVGTQTVHLASGPLSLYASNNGSSLSQSPSASTSNATVGPRSNTTNDVSLSSSPPKTTLTLTLAHLAFSLHPSYTTFFTHSKNPRWYFFSLSLPSSPSPGDPSPAQHSNSTVKTTISSTTASENESKAVGSGSYIRLTLPELSQATTGSDAEENERARDAFEEALIAHGFLNDPNAPESSTTTHGHSESYLSLALGNFTSFLPGIGGRHKRNTSSQASSASAKSEATNSKNTSWYSTTTTTTPSSSSGHVPETHSFVDGTSSETISGRRSISYSGRAASALANVSIGVGERVVHLFGLNLGPSSNEPGATTDGHGSVQAATTTPSGSPPIKGYLNATDESGRNSLSGRRAAAYDEVREAFKLEEDDDEDEVDLVVPPSGTTTTTTDEDVTILTSSLEAKAKEATSISLSEIESSKLEPEAQTKSQPSPVNPETSKSPPVPAKNASGDSLDAIPL